ncbi:succinate dehydrogenase and fumarate reductase iron-sulfur protein [Methylocella silvestris BL2]|uniref:Succinate dehydrogenase iron-sulfur subunit n=1 Tax=Methylocella silvestris (strain DSM 15510 / CIP 108128 / LMG 27833 / NCIMB 13906 / BL2) TaxID=395965 RepID=B8EKD1_METSB|nr:succinate dehydrogenase/fumarate reductase iron-sulfur subunit [Methylocella silvestris]ACK50671.1 succinate dehydrogenase and fumarate reductase iron-sulfur protein [Methylocella silvestris BL2]
MYSETTAVPVDKPKIVELRVLRYRPASDTEPVFMTYHLPFTDDMSVLQALQAVKVSLDATLSFRWSCRMAVCGSCGMMINGEPKLACSTFLRDLASEPVTLEPLHNFPIERDLIVTVGDFVKKIESIYPYIMPKAPKTIEDGAYLQTPGQMAAYGSFADCINCMLCYAACPQFGANPDFIGPGAMALLQRYNGDSRDGGQQLRLEQISGEDGVWSCTAVGVCSDVCPKQVDPANAVNQNKSNSAFDFFLRFLRKEPSA